MSAEAWQVDNDGWTDRKERETDPLWWYELRNVTADGTVVGPFSLFYGEVRSQYRKRAPEWIAAETERRARVAGEGELRYSLLAVLSSAQVCPKCGGERYRLEHFRERDDFGGHDVLQRTCKGCRFQSFHKPLDWEASL